MTEFGGEQILLKIYTGESDQYGGKPVYQWIVEKLKQQKFKGATVLRGIQGFGAGSHVRSTHILRLSQDLPIIIEIIDTREKIDSIIPWLKDVIGKGLITAEKVHVVKYGGNNETDLSGNE